MRSGERAPLPVDSNAIRDLLIIFAVHNVEEVAHLPADVARYQQFFDRMGARKDWLQRDVMSIATASLTALCAVSLSRARRRPGPVGDGVAIAACAALGGNALTHAARAAADLGYNGGLATSPALLWAAWRLGRQATSHGSLSPGQVLAVLVAANAAVPPLIIASLATAHRLVCRLSPTLEGVPR